MAYEAIPDSSHHHLISNKTGTQVIETYGDDDERVFIFDSNEYFSKDEYCSATMASFQSVSNLVYRVTHRTGLLFFGYILMITLPFWGFILGMTDALLLLVLRPFIRLIGKVYGDMSGLNNNSRWFRYRNYRDYRAHFLVDGASISV